MAAERDVNLKIVLEVEKHPCLYNFKLPDYTRKDLIEKAWSEVGKKTNMSMSDCKEKWKNVWSAFFIVAYVKPTNPIENAGNIEHEHPEEPASPDPAEKTDEKLQEVETLTAPTRKEHCPERATSSTSIRRKIKLNDLDSSFLKYLQNKKKNSATNDETAKRYFLLSLIPEVKNMNDQRMRQFKMKVLLLIENILSESSKSRPGSSNSQDYYSDSPTLTTTSNSNTGFSHHSFHNISPQLDSTHSSEYFSLRPKQISTSSSPYHHESQQLPISDIDTMTIL
ncbi:uncharacterized protein [Onthophagus taurus]|uniref:uncharacterized protein n=1 Tax=Onthophagus taurus TaxID=166361 RepID=UPI000C1FDC93|nr:uncharacterized protein LOC111422926 [Onthophagus taurus]